MHPKALEHRINMILQRISQKPLRAVKVLYIFYEQWFESFGFKPTDEKLCKEGSTSLDVSKINHTNFEITTSIAGEIGVQCGIFAVNAFNELIKLQKATNLEEIDFHSLWKDILDGKLELDPAAVCDYLKAALDGKKVEFKFLNIKERNFLLSFTTTETPTDPELKRFIDLCEEKSLNPYLLKNMDQGVKDRLLKIALQIIEGKDMDFIMASIYAGASFQNVKMGEHSLLIWAAEHGYIKLLNALLEKMIHEEINKADEHGKTALHYAVINSKYNVVDALLKKMTPEGINQPDEYGNKAINYAINFNYLGAIYSLIKAGCDFQDLQIEGKTILQWATDKLGDADKQNRLNKTLNLKGIVNTISRRTAEIESSSLSVGL